MRIKKGFQKMKPFEYQWELTGSNRRPSACKAELLTKFSSFFLCNSLMVTHK